MDPSWRSRIEDLESQLAQIRAIAAAALSGAGVPVQFGSGQLVNGGATIAATVAPTSAIIITGVDPLVNGGANPITNMAGFFVVSAGRFPGQFSVVAVDDTGTILPNADCTFDWVVVG